ncbi:MAG: alpha/beta fold hydrolase [Acidobacteria bacterium]|nr:alpha/beta fold hydrolase [Acidobacteriota bacterium]
MKNLVRLGFVVSLALLSSFIVNAQEVPARAEFECIRLVSTNRYVVPGPPDKAITYHHVWIPNLHTFRFTSDGLNLAYNVEGAGKELVIVVAGGPGLPREYFQPNLSPLSRYMTLVYYDRRADTLSTKTPHDFVTIAEMADDIDVLRRTLGYNRVTLLAHSLGGGVAIDYALRYPDHVKRLILVGTSAALEDQRTVERRLLQSLTPEQLATYNASDSAGRSTISCEQVSNRYRALFPAYFHKQLESRYQEQSLYSVYFDALGRKLLYVGHQGPYDYRSRLNEIKVPVLIIQGKYDLVTPMNQAEEMKKGFPSARLAVLRYSGHFPFIEENFMFTEWVRQFMSGTVDLKEDLDVPQEIATPALDQMLERLTPKATAPVPGKNN